MWKAIERLKQAEKIACVANPLALVAEQQPVYHPQTYPTQYNQTSSTRTQQDATRNRGKAIDNSPRPIYDQEPSMVDDDDETSKDKEIDKLMALISLSFKKNYKPTSNNLRTSSNTIRANQDNSLRIHRNASEQIDQNNEDVDLTKERELLASLIQKLKCKIDENKNCNTLLETSNKILVEKLKSEIADFRNKNKSLTEANNKLFETIDLLYADFKKSKAELKRRDSIEYALKMELGCAKVRGDLLSYKMEYERSYNKYT
nr:hypothetical protein [Tanacetum cinerariifolium]